jgi:hypothetical protein
VRENGLADSLSLSLADACNPLLQAHPTWAQDNTEAAGFPFACFFPPSCSVSRRPIPPFVLRLRDNTEAGTRGDNLLVGPGTPPWSKRRQLARQVGACCVLTNSFPSSSR